MRKEHITDYIKLRKELTKQEWDTLNSLYEYELHEKERKLTQDLSLNDSEVEVFRKNAQRIIEN